MTLTLFLILIAVVIFTCVLLNNATSRIGVPVLLAFILLGMLFSNNGLIPIRMEDHTFVEQLCTAALVFIMFYGGFGTRWSAARPVAAESVLLATVGVVMTAGITGVACHFLLKWSWLESLLLGSVVSSTDAASVFSILRSHNLGLKNGTAPLLEMESGSNDPCSYMLTSLMLSLLGGGASAGGVIWMLVAQLGFGAIFGWLIAKGAAYLMRRIRFETSGFDSMFLIAIALFSYAIPSLVGGNGYLSAYIVGIMLGNEEFGGKKNMVHFFDGFTGLMQVLIFFMLGLLAHPALLNRVALPAVVIFLVLLFVARPVAVALLLTPFGKYSFRQQMLISFCGLRGAASIVFAIMATVGEVALENDIFNTVFCIVLISIALQGWLLPWAAKRLDMIDPNADIMKTFSDFSEEVDLQFTEIRIDEKSTWNGKYVKDLQLPGGLLLCMLIREGVEPVVPRGSTMLEAGDKVVVCSKALTDPHSIRITKHLITEKSSMRDKPLRDYQNKTSQAILIMRGNETIIPHGDTVIRVGDVIYINGETELSPVIAQNSDK